MTDIPFGRHGVLTRKAAVAALGTYRVRVACETGQLFRPWREVLVDAGRAADPLTLTAAALTMAGERAVVSGPTAAYLHGCDAASPTPVHLHLPYGHTPRSRDGIVLHNGPLDDADVTERHGLPVLALDRVVADLLCGRAGECALAVADQALALTEPMEREVLRRAVARRLSERPDPRGTVRAGRLLELATGRAESPPESWLLFKLVDAGYPVPEVNWVVNDIDGKQLYRLDLAWPELRIAVEYHGYAAHVGRSEEDEARVEDLRRRGWLHIDVWSDELASPARYQAELDAAFRRRGVDMGHRTTGLLQPRRHRDPADRWRQRGPRPRPVRLDALNPQLGRGETATRA